MAKGKGKVKKAINDTPPIKAKVTTATVKPALKQTAQAKAVYTKATVKRALPK